MLARHFKIYTLTILYEGKSGFFYYIYIYFFLFTPIRYIVIVDEPAAPQKRISSWTHHLEYACHNIINYILRFMCILFQHTVLY